MYNNRFFETLNEAKAFQREHGRHLLKMSARARHETKMAFMAEMVVAWDARRERIRWTETPYCVAWNEREEART